MLDPTNKKTSPPEKQVTPRSEAAHSAPRARASVHVGALRADSAAGPSLGNTDEPYFHPVPDGTPGPAKSGMARQYRLQRLSADLLPGWRVGQCGMHAVKAGTVHITRNSAGHHGVTGVRRCGSGWVCPVCAPKIASGRVEEIDRAIAAWHAEGGDCVLVALTVQHTPADSLDKLISTLAEAQGRLWSGRSAQDFAVQFGVAGQIRNTEVTWGMGSGWHPHSHVLLFTRGLTDDESAHMIRILQRRWADAVDKAGWYASPIHGLHGDLVARYEERVADAEVLLLDRKRVSAYFGKTSELPTAEELAAGQWGPAQELSFAHIKVAKGVRFSPWALLIAAGEPDNERAPALWQEFADATKGRVMIRWSKGLRDRLRLSDTSTDEELAEAAEKDTQVVAAAVIGEWRWLVLQGRAVQLLADLDQANLDAGQVQPWLDAWLQKHGRFAPERIQA